MSNLTADPTVAPPRRRLAALLAAAALVVAVGAGGYAVTTAFFSDSVEVKGTMGAATLSVGNTTTKSLSVSNLLPGKWDVIGSATFANTGTVEFAYSVTIKNFATPSTLSAADIEQVKKWVEIAFLLPNGGGATGTLAEPPVASKVGTLAVGHGGFVQVDIRLSPEADNRAQAFLASFDIEIRADQII